MKRPAPSPAWLETTAQVTSCKYRFSRMNTLTLGISLDKNRFLIGFSYYAHGKSYTGEFTAPTYMEQGTRFSIGYNPLRPEENTKSQVQGSTPLFAIGIAGSIVLSLIYLSVMRGCN